MGELLLVEARVALVDSRQVEQPDDLVQRHLLPVVLRTPAQEAEKIDQRLRQEAAPLVFLDQRALVALGHLARAVLFQDQRNVGVHWQKLFIEYPTACVLTRPRHLKNDGAGVRAIYIARKVLDV